jgi:hypothetical protein
MFFHDFEFCDDEADHITAADSSIFQINLHRYTESLTIFKDRHLNFVLVICLCGSAFFGHKGAGNSRLFAHCLT